MLIIDATSAGLGSKPKYDCHVGGTYLGRFSTAPMCEACRAMLAQGIAGPDDAVSMRLNGGAVSFKPARVGFWADRTVSEGDGTSPRLARYSPWSGPNGETATMVVADDA